MPLHRTALFAILIVLVAALPARLRAAELVDGVYVDASGIPVPSLTIVAPLGDHNVVSVGVDAATACFRITVNGKTAEVPEVSAAGPIADINYSGSAGGFDQVSYDGVGGSVSLYWGNNTLTVANNGSAFAYLFGDNNSASATSGGSITYDTWGDVHDTFSGNCQRAYPDAPYTATAMTGVFVTYPDIIDIVSPVAQGNVVSVAYDATSMIATVTENGHAVTIALPLFVGFNYYGSWNGGDSVTGVGANGISIYGSNNTVTLDHSIGTFMVQGSGNTVTDTHGPGYAEVYGTDTITGATVSIRGPAPVVPTVYAGGTGSPPTVATPAAASPSPVTGTTTMLSVLGADADGESTLTYTWMVTSAQGASVSANGTNAAKVTTATFPMPGSYTFEVIIRNQENLVATSSVTVLVGLQSIALSPGSASVGVGGTQQFTAVAEDSSGTALAVQPSFTWTVSGGGTISASGLLTAGANSGGPFTVTASAGGKQATASLTITHGSSTTSTGSASSASGTSTATSGLGATATAGSGDGGGSGGGGGGGCGFGGGLGLLLMAALGCRRGRGR